MTSIFYNISTFSRVNLSASESDIYFFVKEYKRRILGQLSREEEGGPSRFVSYGEARLMVPDDEWLEDNYERFLRNTANEHLVKENYLSELGYITSMIYDPSGEYIICGHSTGLIQMRHGKSGIVLATLRNIQFPHKPVYALAYSRMEERVCYAACTDGAVYRIEIPERSSALTLSLNADNKKMVVGYGDSSLKIYDMETQEVELTYKVHKLRLQFIPKKMQRVHIAPVCAVRCHDTIPTVFVSAAWDRTLRIWDVRCKVGCMMTFEGVDCAHDSIDLNREQIITGSWQPTEALSLWDLKTRRRLSVIRVQNRRPDVDGEYIYACRYWRSPQYNRKGKYAIIGGSGTKCVEIINLHNRYIACSYPAPGTVLAVASHEDRIAFGGTAPVLNIVSFHDPKHEKFPEYDESEYHDCPKTKAGIYVFD